ncbi:ribonuclease III [Methanobacterium oryzae]|uniref:ribonuclease III n=1 Tax=Methanobacterium oryzae TaxID=69540 RepID=UPI003D20D339
MQLLKNYSIKPYNIHLYELAFLHESYSNENNLDECYERLEFLGDAVLDLVVSEYLYTIDSNLTEGQLTRTRSNYVCKKALYTYSTELGLDQYIKLGAGAELSRRELNSVISDVFESFIGALYLDQGLEVVKEFLNKTVISHIENEDIFFYDYKSELKLLCDQKCMDLCYELIHEEGEPHEKTFTMAVLINGKEYGTGVGGNKKEAEQNAAKIALSKL